jgi:cytochrome P450
MPGTLTDPALDQRLTLLLASDPATMAGADAIWDELRATAPVHRHGAVVLVSDYARVKDLVRDTQRLSNRYAIDGTLVAAHASRLSTDQQRAQREIAEFESLYVSRSDGDQHGRLRAVAHRAFTPRRIAAMSDTLVRYTDDLLRDLPTDSPVDFRAEVAYPLPMMAICDMLGVPASERTMIHDWSRQLGRNRGGDDPAALMAAHEALKSFRGYVEEILVPLRRSQPESDLLSALLTAEQGQRLSDQELTAMFVVLLFAGHETTTNLLATGLLELLRHPDQWALLCEDPERIPLAVEELLRWVSPIQWDGRVAAEDFVLDDVAIARGDSIFLVLAAANRDPAQFPDPGELDVTREQSRAHLALGFGPHFCLGNALARMEATIALTTLVRRFPRLRLAAEPAGWQGNAMMRGLRDLPVVLGPSV